MTLIGIESEVLALIVGEVPSYVSIADNEYLHEAKERVGVAIAGIVLISDDLFHRAARADGQCLEFDLHHWQAINEQDHVILVVAVFGVDTRLFDDFVFVLTPIGDVH